MNKIEKMEKLQRIFQAMGVVRVKGGPNCCLIQSWECGNYRRLLIQYRTEGEETARAYLLIPDKPAQGSPAAVVCHRHNHDYTVGKSEPAGLLGNHKLNWAQELCRRGMVVICPDCLCFEGRRETTFLYPEYFLSDSDEKRKGSYLTAEGRCMLAKSIGDLMRTVDVLAEWMGEVPREILAVGCGLGGRLAMWLALADERITSCVSAGGIALVSWLIAGKKDMDMFLVYPGLLQFSDYDELAAMMCPRHFLMIFEAGDPQLPESCREKILRSVEAVYAAAKMEANFEWELVDAGDYGRMRESVIKFADRRGMYQEKE